MLKQETRWLKLWTAQDLILLLKRGHFSKDWEDKRKFYLVINRAINAVVDSFYDKVLLDKRVKDFFKNTDMKK